MITFRLFDSLPAGRVATWQAELRELPPRKAAAGLRRRIEEYLDAGRGSALLRQGKVAQIVEDALLHFDGERYRLHAWVVMPNHVHALITPLPGFGLSEIVHSWKSFTAKAMNRLLNRQGAVWQRESFDRYIRDQQHFEAVIEYIEHNPVAARLCSSREDWPFSSARRHKADDEAGETPALPATASSIEKGRRAGHERGSR